MTNKFCFSLLILFSTCCLCVAAERKKVMIGSSLDRSLQPSYVVLPEGHAEGDPRPLLVSLHSWSADLEQRHDALEELAIERGWICLVPDFRGRNDKPEACGSKLAQRDILDAVEWAKKEYSIDDRRIYVTGSSGGGHMTMLMVGRYPYVWAAASAWVGISDLTSWHAKHAGTKYGDMMESVCGGAPGDSEQVDAEYRKRSPLTYLHNGALVPLDIAAGVHDGHRGSVPIRQSLTAFNVIARAVGADAVTEMEMEQIGQPNGRLTSPRPSDQVVDATFGRKVYLRRSAGKSRVTVFEGGHERIALAAIEWLAQHKKQPREHPVIPLVDELSIGVNDPIEIPSDNPPAGFEFDESLGLFRHKSLRGQVVHTAREGLRGLFETRAVRTPKGDLLLMFPEGNHYAAGSGKVNDMIAYRSKDNGTTWQGPTIAFDISFSQHGFIPLIPRGGTKIYAFGTQPIPNEYSREKGRHENTPIGFRWSDDDGYSWSDATLIRPLNDPGFLGMSVTRMCETDNGTWILGSHAADWSKHPLETRQYVLRSDDRGKTWTLLPGKRPEGWYAPQFSRMDEGRPIAIGQGEVLFSARTPTGRIWMARSFDHGMTWSKPTPSTMVHPDAPPMIFHLSDGETLLSLHHNRHIGSQYTGLSGNMDGMQDRSEIWVSLSNDGGRMWSEPRFLFANATQADSEKSGWFNHNVSYLDAVIDGGIIHVFCPHLWNRAIHMTIPELELANLPTKSQLKKLATGI